MGFFCEGCYHRVGKNTGHIVACTVKPYDVTASVFPFWLWWSVGGLIGCFEGAVWSCFGDRRISISSGSRLAVVRV